MIKIDKEQVVGWEHAIRGMRNPLESWEKSDSYFNSAYYDIGENDIYLMNRLAEAGTDHSKYLRMLVVYADIVAPLYWWKEYDTYKVGTVANSCSTMHKIQSKEFTLDDFSHEHLCDTSINVLSNTIRWMNDFREQFLSTNDKSDWWQMIQLLPSSYNQRRTVMLSYQVLKNMYNARKNHKLDEWREFCKWIETLPYSEMITGKDVVNSEWSD